MIRQNTSFCRRGFFGFTTRRSFDFKQGERRREREQEEGEQGGRGGAGKGEEDEQEKEEEGEEEGGEVGKGGRKIRPADTMSREINRGLRIIN